METFEKTFTLPSNGYFGGPKQVTLRAMTTKEEKLLYTSRDLTFLDRLIKSCCVEPKDLDTGLLHQNDIMYLTFALRELTFGSTYLQEVTCPMCGHKQQAEIDITEMEVKTLDTDGIEEKLTVKLPVNKDTLQLKLLSSGDIRRIDKMIKTKVAKGRLRNPDEYELLVKMAELVVTRNGEDFESEEEKLHYVDTLNLRDLNVINKTIASLDFSLDNSNVRVCSNCGEDMEVAGLICPEFFHPTE